jgi:hypothetical protein
MCFTTGDPHEHLNCGKYSQRLCCEVLYGPAHISRIPFHVLYGKLDREKAAHFGHDTRQDGMILRVGCFSDSDIALCIESIILSKYTCDQICMQNTWGKGQPVFKWEGRMVDVGRRVVDCIKVFQQKTLAVICPLAQNSCLNNHEHRSQ